MRCIWQGTCTKTATHAATVRMGGSVFPVTDATFHFCDEHFAKLDESVRETNRTNPDMKVEVLFRA